MVLELVFHESLMCKIVFNKTKVLSLQETIFKTIGMPLAVPQLTSNSDPFRLHVPVGAIMEKPSVLTIS